MSQIEISCFNSDAILTNTPNIFSGGNVDSVKFKFDSNWSGFATKTAVFYTNPKETALQILDSNNVANIPQNMISQQGKLSVGVIGTNANNEIKTSKILTYLIGKGAVTNDIETTSATPDIWLQMLSIVERNKQICDNMKLEVDESQMVNKANKDFSNVTNAVLENKGIARVVTGSYVGTGNYGNSYPNTLTFDFAPKCVVIAESNGSFPLLLFRGCDGYDYEQNSVGREGKVTWTNNSVSWYYTIGAGGSSTTAASFQYNTLNAEYSYFAIV